MNTYFYDDIVCPVCGAIEVHDDGSLAIRGWKIGDQYGHWSQCLMKHEAIETDHGDLIPSTIWFSTGSDQHPPLIEIEVNDGETHRFLHNE